MKKLGQNSQARIPAGWRILITRPAVWSKTSGNDIVCLEQNINSYDRKTQTKSASFQQMFSASYAGQDE